MFKLIIFAGLQTDRFNERAQFMNIPSKYDPGKTEDKWYAYWMDQDFFKSEPDGRESYTIVIPPPNVTGVLHMGHMLNNTIQDILIRRARMGGKNALWVPGTDHASIATEARVVAKLKEEGKDKSKMSREEFLEHAWDWREKHGGIILEQLRKLGASCDWSRTKFTMDPDMSESVLQVFVDLYNKGLIYRGIRMVNWDPQAQTAVSDEEVIYKEVDSKLYYIRYRIEGENDHVTIATTRPETILGDTAVCVHPEDDRFRHLHGKTVIIPLVDRPVPMITDDYVDREFGTGALKITPAHDEHDYDIGLRHGLDSIHIFNDDGTLSDQALLFVGKDRFEARRLITAELDKKGYLVKVEDYVNKVGYSERTNAVIEPKLSVQWFLKMKELAAPALQSINNGSVKLVPPKYKNIYRHWMENVRDWCISRQLWWGHRIPAWHLPDSQDFIVAMNEDEALEKARLKSGNQELALSDLRQDEDVLDTWFSSWLWPISVFDGIRNPENADFKYYYPTSDLVTAPEILFFWVARMIMAGFEYTGKKPFHNVYLTGIVRDKLGRKMSKSLGNSPDPIELIEKHGADGVRVGMLLCSPAGGDLLFDESLLEQGRNFGNKIWNAFRLVKSWKTDPELPQPEASGMAINWFKEKLNESLALLEDQFSRYRLSEALMNVYKLFWDEFSSWYLEMVKPAYGEAMDQATHEATKGFLETLLKILHPFMPFITEEIWHLLKERRPGESIMNTGMPVSGKFDSGCLARFEKTKEAISAIRSVRKEKKIPLKDPLSLMVCEDEAAFDNRFGSILKKMGNLSEITFVKDKPGNAVSFIVKTTEYFIRLGDKMNVAEEMEKLKKELEYTRGFLASVLKKLNNQRFIKNAPETVVKMELEKKMDAEIRIKTLTERIASLK